MSLPAPDRPNWEALESLAALQAGLFTTRQAEEAGFSRALLAYHTRQGRFRQTLRGIYRFARHPTNEQEEFIALWLATDGLGVFSHETALLLHGLSDALPARLHLTLPPSWRRRRLPATVSAAYAEVPEADRTWAGAVPVTTVARTLVDCARAGVQQEFIDDAVQQSLSRGLVTQAELMEARNVLAGR